MHRQLSDFLLPQPADLPANEMLQAELDVYPIAQQAMLLRTSVPLLNEEQKFAFDTIMREVHRATPATPGRCFFIDGVGGAGKTFTYTCLLSAVRAEGKIAIPVATSGIAALLLPGGRTAHSRFKIPVKGLDQCSSCFISRAGPLADLIRAAALIVWDEAPMGHRHIFEALERTLRDVMAATNPALAGIPWGGKVVVLGGDFRQILPVVPHAQKAGVIAATLNHSPLWREVQVLRLHRNMRVQRIRDAGDEQRALALEQFSRWLLRVGNGTEPINRDIGDDAIRIPDNMCCTGEGVEMLVEEIYGGLRGCSTMEERIAYITQHAIVTPFNDKVDNLCRQVDEACCPPTGCCSCCSSLPSPTFMRRPRCRPRLPRPRPRLLGIPSSPNSSSSSSTLLSKSLIM